jgi:glutathione S-transferase
MAPVLAYWKLRGRANPIRLLLHYAGVNYEEKFYDMGNIGEWFQEKETLSKDFDFLSLPYYVDGDIKIAQTKNILAHLGRKHGLDGTTENERIRMSLGVEFLDEMFQSIVHVAYPLSFPPVDMGNNDKIHETLRAAYEAQLPTNLERIAKFLKGHKWVAGDRLTYVDFFVYDVLDMNRLLFDPKHVQGNHEVSEYIKRFEALNGVKQFLASPPAPPMPIFSPFAMFGGTPDFKPKISK